MELIKSELSVQDSSIHDTKASFQHQHSISANVWYAPKTNMVPVKPTHGQESGYSIASATANTGSKPLLG